MVGTDIAHAVILTGVTSLLHWKAGNVDFTLVGSLLIGSIPGGMLGSQLSTRTNWRSNRQTAAPIAICAAN